MGNHMANAVGALKRRKRSVANVVSVGAIGALALGTLGTGVATAQNMIGSGDIKRDAVGSWQLRGANDGQTPAVGSHHILNGTIGFWDMSENSVGPRVIGPNAVGADQIADGAVGPDHFSDDVQTGAQTNSVTEQLDDQVNVGLGEPGTTLESLEVAADTFVTANATLHSFAPNDDVMCFLVGPSGDNLAEANPHPGREQSSVHLSGVTQEAGEAQLKCHSDRTEGKATDISMAMVT